MNRLGLIAILLFVSLAAAESQEDLYFRAMKAEEAGDISLAIELFEKALEEPGPYTAELQEIVDDYRAALGIPHLRQRRLFWNALQAERRIDCRKGKGVVVIHKCFCGLQFQKLDSFS